MKKKIIYSSAFLTAILSATTVLAGGPEIIPVQPDYFTGFFVGGTGGVHETIFNINASTNIDAFDSTVFDDVAGTGAFTTGPSYTSLNGANGVWGGFGGVQGGLGVTVQHVYYLGVLGFGEWGKQSNSATTTNSAPGSFEYKEDKDNVDNAYNSLSNNTTLTQKTTVSYQDDYGVIFKPGLLLTPTIMVFGEVGAMWANLKVQNTATYNVNGFANDVDAGGITDQNTITGSATGSSSSGSQTKTGLVVGGGFETFILPGYFGNRVTAGVDYRYANFGHVTTTTNVAGFETTQYQDSDSDTKHTFNSQITGTTSATASASLSTLNGFVNVYFGNSLL